MNKIKVLIAEDHTLVAKLIWQMLDKAGNIEVVGTVSDGLAAIEAVQTQVVDVVLMDIDMPSLDGIKTTLAIRSQFHRIKILILSNHIEAHLIQRALKSGANGYLSKFAESDEVVEAIQAVYNGDTYYCKTSMKAIMEHLTTTDQAQKIRTAYLELTGREKEILNLIANEYSTKDISNKLVISIRTVETHRRNIMKKLGVKNTAGMMKLSLEHNLIEEEN